MSGSGAPAPRAAILVTGNEVLRGRIQERNAGHLARTLEARGIPVVRVLVVGDRMEDLTTGLRELLAAGVDLVCTSGGLGPTHDDLTMAAVAEVTGRRLRLDPRALERVVARRGPLRAVETITAETRRAVEEKQATLPERSRLLEPVGTAPGCIVTHGAADVVVLPGPPWELRAMWEAAHETPEMRSLLARAGHLRERVLRLYGVVESEFVQALAGIDPAERRGAEVGVSAKQAELEVVIRAPEGRPDAAEAVARGLVAAFGDRVYSTDGRTVDTVVADALRASGATLGVAESCTGGGLGSLLTEPAGASGYFLGGVIAYDNRVKERVLGVPAEVLVRHGAVSEESARAMADGVRRLLGCDWALSVTGVAGPGGGTPEKPVGLVWIGVAGPAGTEAREYRLRGDRGRIRERAAVLALHRLRLALAERAARAA